ncbi:hypothetical protein ABZ532_27605 [Streptomyces sp. NPDC019396]|uniref:hypothetical protein n=1 Tax=Streptomyces sp. NPDC019396 TaxID=3154687 RepID=UPI00340988ED
MNIQLPFRLLAAATVAGLMLTACSGSGGSTRTSGSSPAASAPTAPEPTGTAPTPTPKGTSSTTKAPSATPSPSGTPPLGSWSLQPVWPFTTLAQAQVWERAYRSGGHQPWHLDPARTALSFTRDYLDFTGIDRITSRAVSGRHARIGVAPTGSEGGTAAVIHLVRFGGGQNAPWEVVGTDDTTFSLTTPAYGTLARSPLETGGQISGVDESIRVQVRQPSSTAPLGTSPCCTSAGGDKQPWHVTVPFNGARDPVLTVVASTGGHVSDVERFTITAVRTH